MEPLHLTKLILRTGARYLLAGALALHAFILIFPIQMPFPTLIQLNTNYGDFLPAEIFRLTVGVAKAGYQFTVGLTMLGASLLLFFRRTATLGALVAAGVLLNIVLANFAYNLDEQLYSVILFVLSLLILAQDLPVMYQLMLEKPVRAAAFQDLPRSWELARKIVKPAFVTLILAYGVYTYVQYEKLQKPDYTTTATGIHGLYRVTEFSLDGKMIPDSLDDSDRWQDVVFDRGNQVSILSGTAPRASYSYDVDLIKGKFNLRTIDGREALSLSARSLNTNTIVINGKLSTGQVISARLEKQFKKYLLIEGRRKPIKL